MSSKAWFVHTGVKMPAELVHGPWPGFAVGSLSCTGTPVGPNARVDRRRPGGATVGDGEIFADESSKGPLKAGVRGRTIC
jgi:hypothetical protein